MKISEIDFGDNTTFKDCVLATGCEEAEDVVKLICRDKKYKSLNKDH